MSLPEGLNSVRAKWAWKVAGAAQTVTAAMTHPEFWVAKFDDVERDCAVNLADVATRVRMGGKPAVEAPAAGIVRGEVG